MSIGGPFRLVSKTWNHIVERQLSRWQFPLGPRAQLPRQTQRVDITLPIPNTRHAEGSKLRKDVVWKYMVNSSLPRLAVLAIEDPFPQAAAVEKRLFTLWESQNKHWVNVSILALSASSISIDSNTVSKLSASFSSLGTLILKCRKIEGAVVFPHLHTLDIDADICNLNRWQCPNLRHFKFHSQRRYEYQINGSSLMRVDRLEALIVVPSALELNSHFWSTHPKLQLLGCTDVWLVDDPPSDYPLRHLYVAGDYYSVSPEQISRTFNSLGKGSRTFYICPPDIHTVREYWDQWCEFYNSSTREGIIWRGISHPVDPEVWMPLRREDKIGWAECMATNWAVELNLSFSLALSLYVRDLTPLAEEEIWNLVLVASALIIHMLVYYSSSDILL
ncbi:hypothetical protein FRC17_003060 [Serendipita sp. 399]|nr:hypothetical protein FRC17_003060 [Serendipita sp. 399]